MTDVRLDIMYVGRSTGGVLIGHVPHEGAVEMAEQWIAKNWGSPRPTLMCPPPADKPLPARVIHVWLDSEALDPTWMGNHLIVTWFSNDIPEDPLRSAMARVTERGGWAALSEGFDY